MTCPPNERWREHLEGTLPAEAQAAMTDHLDRCTACQKTLETLAAGGDSILQAAQLIADETATCEPALQEVVAQLKGNPNTAQTITEPSQGVDVDLAFLKPTDKPDHLGRLGHCEPGWVQLFNGKDLKGWQGDVADWRVEEGFLRSSLDGSRRASEILTTRSFENYELRLQYSCMPPAVKHGSGIVILHSDGKPGGQCFQLLLDGDDGSEDPSIRAMRGAKVMPLDTTNAGTPRKDGWNDLTVVCKNGAITVFVNGKLRLSSPLCTPRKGSVGISAIHFLNHFRNIELKELPAQ